MISGCLGSLPGAADTPSCFLPSPFSFVISGSPPPLPDPQSFAVKLPGLIVFLWPHKVTVIPLVALMSIMASGYLPWQTPFQAVLLSCSTDEKTESQRGVRVYQRHSVSCQSPGPDHQLPGHQGKEGSLLNRCKIRYLEGARALCTHRSVGDEKGPFKASEHTWSAV